MNMQLLQGAIVDFSCCLCYNIVMDNKYSVPSFAKREIYDFGITEDSFAIYKELNAISEEIEECRLKNC